MLFCRLALLCAKLSSCACRDVIRSTDCASGGDFGSILELRQDNESLADMLMKTGLPGTAFRAVALVESMLALAKGRRRLTIGVISFGGVGIGGGSSVLTRGVES